VAIPSHALPHVIAVRRGVVVALLIGGGPHVGRQGGGRTRAVLHMSWERGVGGEGAVIADPREMHGVAGWEPKWGRKARGHVLGPIS